MPTYRQICKLWYPKVRLGDAAYFALARFKGARCLKAAKLGIMTLQNVHDRDLKPNINRLAGLID